MPHTATPGNRCQRIVAPKVVASSPVSHPSEDPVKLSMIAVGQTFACLTTAYDHSSEAAKVEARQ
jgi:hypothetical protein